MYSNLVVNLKFHDVYFAVGLVATVATISDSNRLFFWLLLLEDQENYNLSLSEFYEHYEKRLRESAFPVST